MHIVSTREYEYLLTRHAFTKQLVEKFTTQKIIEAVLENDIAKRHYGLDDDFFDFLYSKCTHELDSYSHDELMLIEVICTQTLLDIINTDCGIRKPISQFKTCVIPNTIFVWF